MLRGSSNEPEERIVSLLDGGEKIAVSVIFLVAGLTLALWFLPALAARMPSLWSKMTADCAVGLLLAAASIVLSAPRRSSLSLLLSHEAAIALLALGVFSLVEYADGLSLGIDRWLPYDPQAEYAGRPAPQAALAFAMSGGCLLLMREYHNGNALIADILALALIGLIMVLLCGYLFGAMQVVGVDHTTYTSPQTLLCFCCVAFAIAARRARHGRLLPVLINIGIGSQIVRILLPGVIVVPFATFAAVAYLINNRVLPGAYAHAIGAAAQSFVILCVAVWMGWRINGLERALRDLSLIDELTKVYNHRGFYLLAQQAFREAVRTEGRLTVCYFDLDELKHANDTIGHDAGSKLIQALAAVLRETFRDGDVIGRLGGDEFAVVSSRDGLQLQERLAQMERRVADLNRAGVLRCPLSFSAGFARLTPERPASFEELVVEADAMMYQQKLRRKATRAPALGNEAQASLW